MRECCSYSLEEKYKPGEIITDNTENYVQTLKPTIWVGKNGCTDDIADEVRRQLEARKVIKIKWLQNSDATEEEIRELAKLVAADVLAVRGKIAVLGAKNRGKAVSLGPQKKQQAKPAPTARRKLKNAYWNK
ncbi:MAG TPA: YhbY family RNA-binding protein [Methanocorpusculum sp.]|nr:YhbY family RNA-binding protein [Methanocorpusculum sp.]HJJ69902.1 YhbY family RNA-binding protein [Methanocorpusculum sp.]HJJ71958.1 YhbY family RNA-binding protein [Methanocorpusculum sp.]HJJ75073.1 YhbY family RNA-binding protein [Methanocorpusculum sp.]HJJ75929.1 YhbY family RNA-binding protein [Methanocorpusculum sp.]